MPGNDFELSPRYGLNEGPVCCFWCGAVTNPNMPFGRIRTEDDDDAPAPTEPFPLNYEPCRHCRENFDNGITLLGYAEKPLWNGQPKFFGQYPTGDYIIVTEGFVRDMPTSQEHRDALLKSRTAYVPQAELKAMLDRFQSRMSRRVATPSSKTGTGHGPQVNGQRPQK